MFQAVIGQERLKTQLIHDWQSHQIPSALLIFGDPFAGKFSVALELARMLTCEVEANATCSCPSCQMHQELLHPKVFLLGNRYFQKELEASIQTLQAYIQHQKPIPPNVKLMAIRNLYKLIRRFDSHLWEHDDNRYKEARSLVPALNEMVNDLLRSQAELTANALNELASKAKEVTHILDNYVVNIGQVRSTLHHCTTLAGEKRVVIIEEAHLMQESARNALLKRLEEPQEHLYFILLTTNKEEMMPTILSRLRTYQALPHSHEEELLIIQKIFRNSQVTSLKELLSAFSPEEIARLSQRFLSISREKQSIYLNFSELENTLLYRHIRDLLCALETTIIQSSLHVHYKNKLLQKIKLAYIGYKEYNQNPEIILYALHQEFSLIYKSAEKI